MTAPFAPRPDAPLTAAPVLETERLILRSPRASDAEAVIAFLLDREHAQGFGSEDTRADAWRWFALNVGHWHIHGHGYFTVALKGCDTPVGLCGVWYPEGWPEPELGWVIFRAHARKGYAREAAERVRRYAYEDLGLATLTSNILPDNEASKALARALGATYERTYENVTMGVDELWRHPGPDALARDGSREHADVR